MLAEDETHLDLLARVRACRMPTGIRHHVMTPGSNIRRTLHDAVNLATGAWHRHVSRVDKLRVWADTGYDSAAYRLVDLPSRAR